MAKDIFIKGAITEQTFDQLKREIEETDEKEISLVIASRGGSVDDGFVISNFIKSLNDSGKRKISTNNLGIADSIASVLMLSVPIQDRFITQSSTMLIHDPRIDAFTTLTPQSLDFIAKELDLQKNRIADFYVDSIGGISKEEILNLMSDETNLTAADMVELEIVQESNVRRSLDIAAKKQEINNNKILQKMFDRFKKAKAQKAFSLEGGEQLISSAEELVEGSQITMITGHDADSLEGEYTLENGNIVSADAEGKVLKVTESTADGENEAVTKEDLVEAVKNIVTPIYEELSEQIQALKTTGSTHTPKPSSKNEKVASVTDVNWQKEAGERLRDGISKGIMNKKS